MDANDSGLHEGDQLVIRSRFGERSDFASADRKKLSRVPYLSDSQEFFPERGPQEIDLELSCDNLGFNWRLRQRCIPTGTVENACDCTSMNIGVLLRKTLGECQCDVHFAICDIYYRPILANVLLSAKGNRLAITATDLEVELVASTSVNVQHAGDITVPGRKLLDICRALPEKVSVTLTVEGEKVTVRAGRSRFTLSSLSASEFPTVEEINSQQTLKVEQGASCT